MIDYIVTTKGAIVDPIYPEAIRMVIIVVQKVEC